MRTHENADLAQSRVVAAAQGLDPALDDLRLARGSTEERRADPEQIRLVRIEADARAEIPPWPRRTPAEPLVVTLRAGHGDEFGRHTVQLLRLAALHVVPHKDAVGHLAQQRLARQVIP